MVTRYFLTVATLLAATVAQSSDDVIERQIIDGKLYEDGEYVFNMVEHSDSDDEMAAGFTGFSLPTLPTTTTTSQISIESIPAGDLLRTVGTGRVTKPFSRSMPELRQRGKKSNARQGKITDEHRWDLKQFNAAASILIEKDKLDSRAKALYDRTKNLQDFSNHELRNAANFAETRKFDTKKWIERNNRVKVKKRS